jgi:hypothetical protein
MAIKGRNMANVRTIRDLAADFRAAAVAAGDFSDSKAQNDAARKMQGFYRELRNSEVGRQAIIELMSDGDSGVRLASAARCLQWVPEQAKRVLEALRAEDSFPDSFEAEMVLEQFAKGKLTVDY